MHPPRSATNCIIFFTYIVLAPSTGLYFSLNGTIYLPGDTIHISEVNRYYISGASLVCVTSNVNTMCCRGSDNSGEGAVGNWLYPDGAIVSDDYNYYYRRENFFRSSHAQQIRLYRKRDFVSSLAGIYTCEVPDGSNTSLIHRATITLSKY